VKKEKLDFEVSLTSSHIEDVIGGGDEGSALSERERMKEREREKLN
jgi:hypothetical protein